KPTAAPSAAPVTRVTQPLTRVTQPSWPTQPDQPASSGGAFLTAFLAILRGGTGGAAVAPRQGSSCSAGPGGSGAGPSAAPAAAPRGRGAAAAWGARPG